jgi:hypothetical protein
LVHSVGHTIIGWWERWDWDGQLPSLNNTKKKQRVAGVFEEEEATGGSNNFSRVRTNIWPTSGPVTFYVIKIF